MTQQRRTPGGRGASSPGGRGGSRRRGPRLGGGQAGSSDASSNRRGGTRRTGSGRSASGRPATPGTAAPGGNAGRNDGAPRGSARPAGSRRGPTGPDAGAAQRTRAPQPRALTGRAAVLALVLLALLLAYGYPIRVYLAQQAEIASIEAHQSAQRDKIDELAEEREKWNDDAYVISQARRRLQYALPGQKVYVVIGNSPSPEPSGSEPPDGQSKTGRPWYGKLWSSIVAADRR